MSLEADTRFGHYHVTARIGAGGMGEVFRAKDTKLGRDVAVKVLPRPLTSDGDFIARFEREAQILAALNHPNIAQIYGVERLDDNDMIVMELVDGDTLESRIAAGPMAVDEAVAMAEQITRGLEAAHENGIVHRDLKPSNIVIRADRTLKILDFGTAKAPDPGAGTKAPQRLTEVGVRLGTPAYMSPEQSRGQPIDRRTDIWAFGCVLYEMLTGQPAFGGEDGSVMMARVLEREANLGALPAAVPAAVRQTIELCLKKDPARRLHDFGDTRLALLGAFEPGAREPGARPERGLRGLPTALAIGGLAVVAVAVVLVWTNRGEPPADRPLLRFTVNQGIADPIGPTTAISPDGTRVVYRALGPDAVPMLATRLLSEAEETVLAGTEGAYNPSFSPDGQWIAYLANNRLMKVRVSGGIPVALADAAVGRYASWSEDGHLYAELNPFSGIYRVPENGGEPEELTRPRQFRHAWPQALPDGRVLYTAGLAGLLDNGRIEVIDPATDETSIILEGGYMARFLPTSDTSGSLLYLRGSVLYATSLDLTTLDVGADRVELAVDVASVGADLGNAFDISASGIVVYTSGSRDRSWPISWLDADGNQQEILSTRQAYYTPRVSPDGQKIAYAVENTRGQDIYVHDIERNVTTRLTFNAAANLWPVWSHDAEHLAFTSLTGERAALWWIRADGTGEPRLLLERDNPIRQIMLAPDGATLAFTEQDADTGSDLWLLPLDLTEPDEPIAGSPEPFARTPFNEGVPAFSRDGRWIAYLNDELGGYEVWVRPFPEGTGRWQISNGNGGYPFWSKTEDTLFFQGNGTIMRVEYTVEGDRLLQKTPEFWGMFPTAPAPVGFESIDLAPDAERFAILPGSNSTGTDTARATFLLNAVGEADTMSGRDRIPGNVGM